MNNYKTSSLADDYQTVYESPSPKDVYCYSPGICRCPNGRLIATLDIGGPGIGKIATCTSGKGDFAGGNIGKCFISDDHGATWTHVLDFPFYHARPFVAGNSLYILGHNWDLKILKSDDWGGSWSEPIAFSEGQQWHQAPCNVWYANDKIYLIMERYSQEWGWHSLCPVVMAAKTGDDLLEKNNWTFSNEFIYCDRVKAPYGIGAPFFTPGQTDPTNPKDKRDMAPVGWLESNIVQFNNPNHVWFDPCGKTFHIICRAHTGSTNMAMLAKAIEDDAGNITVSLEQSPAGEDMIFIPCPGGQMKFHILYDEVTELFWLLSTQATDSMVRPETLSEDRFNLPNNERRRLQLNFSKNCIDWCFAGLVTVGETEKASRHYASMVIDGENLCVLSRSGDKRAFTSHDGNLISFHTIKNFRSLIKEWKFK